MISMIGLTGSSGPHIGQGENRCSFGTWQVMRQNLSALFQRQASCAKPSFDYPLGYRFRFAETGDHDRLPLSIGPWLPPRPTPLDGACIDQDKEPQTGISLRTRSEQASGK
jgi:hypothetical protein